MYTDFEFLKPWAVKLQYRTLAKLPNELLLIASHLHKPNDFANFNSTNRQLYPLLKLILHRLAVQFKGPTLGEALHWCIDKGQHDLLILV